MVKVVIQQSERLLRMTLTSQDVNGWPVRQGKKGLRFLIGVGIPINVTGILGVPYVLRDELVELSEALAEDASNLRPYNSPSKKGKPNEGIRSVLWDTWLDHRQSVSVGMEAGFRRLWFAAQRKVDCLIQRQPLPLSPEAVER